MKHKWEIKPRGKLTKYYICKVCNMTVVASSKKLANELEPKCEKKKEVKNICRCEKPKRCGDYPGSMGIALLGSALWTFATCNVCHRCSGLIRADKGAVYERDFKEELR